MLLIGQNHPHDFTQPPGGGTVPLCTRLWRCRKGAFSFLNILKVRSYFVAQAGLQLIAPCLCLLDAGRPCLGHHTCYDTFEKRFELGPRHNTYLWDAEDPFQTGTRHLSIDCLIWDPVGLLYAWRNWPKEGEGPVRSSGQLAACGPEYK